MLQNGKIKNGANRVYSLWRNLCQTQSIVYFYKCKSITESTRFLIHNEPYTRTVGRNAQKKSHKDRT